MNGKESIPLEQVIIRLIRTRLFFPLLIVSIIAICMGGYLGERTLEEQQHQMASDQAKLVDRYLDQAGRIIDAVANVADVSTPEYTRIYMKGTWEGYGFFDTLYYLDPEGRIIQIIPEDPRYQDLSLSGLPYFNDADNTTQQTISPPFISFRTGNPTVYLIRPIAQSKGTIVGELSLKTLQQETSLAMGKEGRDFVFILDKSGMLLAHPNEELVKQQTNQGYLEIFRQGLVNDTTRMYQYEGSWVLGSAATIEKAGWIVVDQIPISVALIPYIWTLGFALIAALMLWLILMWTLRRELDQSVVIPLVTLSQGVSSLAKGDYSQDFSLTSAPKTFAELNRLAQDFSNMSQAVNSRQLALQKSEEELINYRDHLEELVKERTNDLAVAKDHAEAANRAKTTFLSSMSHELRTPLNAILGFAQILIRQEGLSAIQREQLQIIRNSGDHLLNLINDLLDLGRIEAQKMEIQHLEFHLPKAIQEVMNITKVKAEEKDLTLQYEPQTLIPGHVIGDERKIKQILLNILSNAVKYTRDGGIIMRVWYPDINSGLFICEVEDSGIGIPQDKLEIIFEPFTNLSSERKTVEGAGLGLSITKNMVELMQGILSVKSEPGKGSTFRFEVKLPPVELSETPLMAEDQISGYEGERKRIFVVDDNPENVALLVSLLRPLGFEVITACNGSDALDVARKEKPDLVLLDLVMPEMDGLDVVKTFRNDPDLDQIPIIGVSASVSPSERRKEFEQVCDGFVGKPISLGDLLEKIHLSLGITWKVVPAPSTSRSLREPTVKEKPMVVPPEQTLQAIISLVKQGMFSGELTSILVELQTDSRYIPFCEQIYRFAQNYDDKRILSFIAGVRERQDYYEG